MPTIESVSSSNNEIITTTQKRETKSMTEDYTEFDQSDDNEDEDDEIGALGSILSWDEDEDGVVGTTPVGVNSSTTTLPELVSFNHMKDKDDGLSYLQQSLVSSNVTATNFLQPTRINYQDAVTTSQAPAPLGTQAPVPQTSQVPVPQTSQQEGQKQDDRSNGVKQKEELGKTNAASAQQQAQLQQQQQQIRYQQQQIQQQQQQIQQHQLQQQIGIQQQQHRMQQHMVTTTPAPQQAQAQSQAQAQTQAQTQAQAQVTQQTLGSQPPSQPQQPQVVTQQQQQPQVVTQQQQQPQIVTQQQQQQQPQALQVAQQSTTSATIPQNLQGALSLLQRNALLAQNGMVMPAVSQPAGQKKSTDQQQQQPTPQFIDPNSILRRLQVAQLQQQFNAVQQAQAVHAQAQAQAQAQAALQQRIRFPGPVQMVPSTVSSGGTMVATAAATGQPSGTTTKKNSTVETQKPPPQTQRKEKILNESLTKSPLVSASDTDGEVSLNQTIIENMSSYGVHKPPEIDTSNMTPDMRQKANRERNREHARNTRLRKKAYLETLKSTVNDLCTERDTLVTERAGAATILVEMNNTRTEVLMSFFALRSANEKRRQLWASILDESSFACILPVTPYRSFPASEVQVSKCQRTILGIDGMMSDTASLHVLLNTLVDRSRFPTASIAFRYTLVTEEAVVAGNQMMARWVMQTLNATQCGARMEVYKQGMLCCRFNSAHKIVGLELMFDVMALMLQLKQAAGSETFSVIPNTVQTCQRSFDTPMVMILADEPYTIVQVNRLWEDMSGYTAEEVVGKTSCRILEGEQTDVNAVGFFMDEIRYKRPVSAMVLHYKKSGERFKNFVLSYPLSTDSRITHYLIFTSYIGVVNDGSDVSSSITGTTVSDNQQVLTNGDSSVVQAGIVQSKFMQQNLRANFNAAQRQAGVAAAVPNCHQIMTLPPVLSNPVSVAPTPSIFPPNLPSSTQNSSAFVPQQVQTQQFQIKASKRHNESISNGDVESSRKQPRTNHISVDVDTCSSVDPSKLVILSDALTK